MSSQPPNDKNEIETDNLDNENKVEENEYEENEENEENEDNEEENVNVNDEEDEVDDDEIDDEIDDIVEDEDEDEDGDFNLDEDGEEVVTKTVGKKTSKRSKITTGTSDNIMEFLNVDEEEDSSDEEEGHMNGVMEDDEYDEYDDDEDPDVYFQKFDEEVNKNFLLDHHPTEFSKNYDEIETLCNIVRDENNNIIDPLHKTLPYLSKYEKTRVLGQRAKQLNSGAKPLVAVPDNIIDGYIIAEMELVQKRIPFIIQRPLHGGACEYWKLRDLEIL